MAFGLLGAALAPGLAQPGSEPGLIDFAVAGWVALLLLLLRRVYDVTFVPWLARRLLNRPSDGKIQAAVELAHDVAASPAGPVTARTWDSASERDEDEKADDAPLTAPLVGGARLRRAPRDEEVMAASSPSRKAATAAAATTAAAAPPATSASGDRDTAEAVHKRAAATADSMWIAALNLALVLGAWYVIATHNGGCTPWSTWDCFGNWPNHPVVMSQRWYIVLSFAYYLYELVGTALGCGTKLKNDMVAHHIATMTLLMLGYVTNITRMQVMWQALFDISNPILHTAKALNASGVKAVANVKWAVFILFAMSFFVCRVVLGPCSIIWPSFTVAPQWLPPSLCYPCWALMVFVYILQLIWFYKIVEIAVKGDKAVRKHTTVASR
ncbi:hypothetical protein HXX76_000256 [Chlamydomonas incerta]|uniref:TLC domain-containing protein n=1 Tax=Chlamydomonas incerta TaxID=51695 RepID=A0A835WDZ7_CHLIN|nr:hypothetical protein HXX76_000256 [Chlamydomonas incerta]|eukprot:KAG2445646.1 hypothetical protein HXX76_000256 [Chlamydomonas incerta]